MIGRATTTLLMTEWVVELTPKIINEIDDLGRVLALKQDQVWADFQAMYRPINAAEVLILVYPPEYEYEVDDGFRRRRHQKIADKLHEELRSRLQVNNDHLIIPHWEIEVNPQKSSGFGVNPHLETEYSW